VSAPRRRRPLNPYLILLLAVLLPGVGHIAAGHPQRGLGFAFFTLFLGALTYLVSTPEQSFLGRHAGGFFVWALSIPDAYRLARIASTEADAQGSSLS
jgi:ABC-type transport system involved in cytochrome c biogenesis permease subunit